MAMSARLICFPPRRAPTCTPLRPPSAQTWGLLLQGNMQPGVHFCRSRNQQAKRRDLSITSNSLGWGSRSLGGGKRSGGLVGEGTESRAGGTQGRGMDTCESGPRTPRLLQPYPTPGDLSSFPGVGAETLRGREKPWQRRAPAPIAEARG